MGLHFYKSYWNGVAHFQDFGDQKIQVCKDLKIERFTPHQVNKKVADDLRMFLLKGFRR